MVQTTTHETNTLSQIRDRVFAVTHKTQKHNPDHHKRQAKERTNKPEQAKNPNSQPPPNHEEKLQAPGEQSQSGGIRGRGSSQRPRTAPGEARPTDRAPQAQNRR
jgi:hypothetical protein